MRERKDKEKNRPGKGGGSGTTNLRRGGKGEKKKS